MAEADPAGDGAKRRVGALALSALVVIFVLLGAALVTILTLEALTMDDRCPVPGLIDTYGEVTWQVWPPGEICTYEGVTFVEPDPWRAWAILVEIVLGVGLFVLWRRSQDAPDPDWAA